MKRKVALLMATLMAGSSLSGSYVSAASVEGIAEENIQTEDVALESTGGEPADESTLNGESLDWTGEGGYFQEDAWEEEEDIAEDGIVTEDDPYTEEEQVIEEPVQFMMEKGAEVQENEPEEGEDTESESKREYDCSALPGDETLLPGWTYDISSTGRVGVRDAEDQDWNWIDVAITRVAVIEGNKTLRYESDVPGEVALRDGQYHLDIAEDAEGKTARLAITWSDGTVEHTYEVQLTIAQERYDTGFDFPSGTNQVLPGETLDITTSLYHYWNNPEDGLVEEYYISVDEDGIDNESVRVTVDEEDQKTLHVKADPNAEPGGVEIPIHYLIKNGEEEKEVGQERIYVDICNDFWTIEMDEELNALMDRCHLGDVIDFNEVEITAKHWVTDPEDDTARMILDPDQDEIRYQIEYDDEVWELQEQEEGSDADLPVLKRVKNGNTRMLITAEKNYAEEGDEPDWQWVKDREIWFNGISYELHLNPGNEEENRIFYGERSEVESVWIDWMDLYDLKDYEIEWKVEQYTDGEPDDKVTCVEGAVYSDGTENDNTRYVLTPVDTFESTGDVHIRVQATVVKNGVEVVSEDTDLHVLPTETDLGSLPQDMVLLPGWGDTLESEYWIWVRDARHPDGDSVQVQVSKVQIEDEKGLLSGEVDEDGFLEPDEYGNYPLNVREYNTKVQQGIVKVSYNYSDGVADEHMSVSGKGEFTIYVDAQKFSTGYELENGNNQLLPGTETTVTTSLFREWYDIDEDSYGGEEIPNYTLEVEDTWNPDLIDVTVDGHKLHVTAKDMEGDTEIPVSYLLDGEVVGKEWIYISVYNEFWTVEPSYLQKDGKDFQPLVGETIDFSEMNIQTLFWNKDQKDGQPETEVQYRVEYDPNAWELVSDNEKVDGEDGVVEGLPILRRLESWGSEIRVIAEKNFAEEGEDDRWEEVARRCYWFNDYNYQTEFTYRMGDYDLNYGRIYTDGQELNISLAIDPELTDKAEVEWYLRNEEGNRLDSEEVALKTDSEHPLQATVSYIGEEPDQRSLDGFILGAIVWEGEREVANPEEWIGIRDVDRDFMQIHQLLYFTTDTMDEMKFGKDQTWAFYREDSTAPNGEETEVIVTGVTECRDDEDKLLDIKTTEDGITIIPKDKKQPGDTEIELQLAYAEDNTDAGSWSVPVWIGASLNIFDEILYESVSGDTDLLPGQTLKVIPVIKTYSRKDGDFVTEPLYEGSDYVVDYDYDPNMLEYDEETQLFTAKQRGETWITIRILNPEDREEEVAASHNLSVWINGSYSKAELTESGEKMLTAGGAKVELPYKVRQYSITCPEGQDQDFADVILENQEERPALHISYENGKILAALDENADLKKGEKKEAYLDLAFLDEEGNTITNKICMVTLHRHDMQNMIDRNATCIEAGSQHQECSVCGEKEASTVIPATGHSFGSYVVTKPSGCTENGVKTRSCTICGKTETMTIPSRGGHSFGAYKVTKAATLFEQGTETQTCTVCGYAQSRTIAKLQGTIRLTTGKLPLQVKKSVQLSRIVTGMTSGDYIASCSSSNPKAATVTNNGTVSGKAAGTTVITIRLASGVEAQVTVTVQKKAVATTSIGNVSKTWNAKIGEKYQLNPVISPVTTTDKVTYTSSNKKVATVSSRGLITAKKAGTAKITVKSGKKKYTITVKVAAPQPTGISGVPGTKSLKKGKSFTIKSKLTPSGATAKITYTSSNKKVATVNSKGKVTAKGKGTAVITVKAGSITRTCTVTVK